MREQVKKQIYDIYRNKHLTLKFGIIGFVGFICNYITLRLVIGTGLNKVVAEMVAALVALHITFVLHDKWTYRIDKTIHRYHLNIAQRYRAYLVSNSVGSLLTVSFFAVFSLILAHFPALALAAVAGLIWNFLINKTIVWHHKPHSVPEEKKLKH